MSREIQNKMKLLNELREHHEMKALVRYMFDRGLFNELHYHAMTCNNYNFGKLVHETFEIHKKKIQSVTYEWTILPKSLLSINVMFDDRYFEIERHDEATYQRS